MKIKLKTPKTVGDLDHQIVIDELVLTHIGVSLEPRLTDKGKATVSIGLTHLASGWFTNVVLYETEDAKALWEALNKGNALSKALIQKIVDSGKLDGDVS